MMKMMFVMSLMKRIMTTPESDVNHEDDCEDEDHEKTTFEKECDEGEDEDEDEGSDDVIDDVIDEEGGVVMNGETMTTRRAATIGRSRENQFPNIFVYGLFVEDITKAAAIN